MKYITLVTLIFLSYRSFAVDFMTVDIESLIISGNQGKLAARELIVGAGADLIGFRNTGELLYAEIKLMPNEMELNATNGMFIKAAGLIAPDSFNELTIEKGKMSKSSGKLGFSASYVSMTNPKAKVEGSSIKLNCGSEKESCMASASRVLIDQKTLLKSVELNCFREKLCNQLSLECAGSG